MNWYVDAPREALLQMADRTMPLRGHIGASDLWRAAGRPTSGPFDDTLREFGYSIGMKLRPHQHEAYAITRTAVVCECGYFRRMLVDEPVADAIHVIRDHQRMARMPSTGNWTA